MSVTIPIQVRGGNSYGPSNMNFSEQWLNERVKRAATVGTIAEAGLLTPEMAKILLERNEENRPISQSHINELTRMLNNGEGIYNGETIKLSYDGLLNDGQHRCHAVLRSGVSLPVFFVFGLTRDSRKTVDTGTKRSPAAWLHMNGVKNSALTAAALARVLSLEAGMDPSKGRWSITEIEAAFAKHPNIMRDFQIPEAAARVYGQSAALFVAIGYLYNNHHPGAGNTFFSMLRDGVAPSSQHAVAALRRRLQSNLMGKAKLPPVEVAALVIKAIRAFHVGKEVNILKWNGQGTDEKSPEAFPEIP